jgi:hypothetical protein
MNEIMCITNSISSSIHAARNRAKRIHPPVRSKSMNHETRKKLRSRCRRIAEARRGVLFIYRKQPLFYQQLLKQRYYRFQAIFIVECQNIFAIPYLKYLSGLLLLMFQFFVYCYIHQHQQHSVKNIFHRNIPHWPGQKRKHTDTQILCIVVHHYRNSC